MDDCRKDSRMDVSMPEPNCGQRLNDTPLADLPLTMAYVPMQRYTQVYDMEKGLCVGTIFPELDKPFLGRSVCK